VRFVQSGVATIGYYGISRYWEVTTRVWIPRRSRWRQCGGSGTCCGRNSRWRSETDEVDTDRDSSLCRRRGAVSTRIVEVPPDRPPARNVLQTTVSTQWSTSCARGDTKCPRPSPPSVGAQAPRAPPSRRDVAVLSHAEYVPTLTAAAALRVKAAVSKAAWWPWPLTFWPWKWCPSHV